MRHLLTALLVILASCGGRTDDESTTTPGSAGAAASICAPDATRACGTVSCPGVQKCLPSGADWGACDCHPSGGAGMAGASAAGSAGASGASGAAGSGGSGSIGGAGTGGQPGGAAGVGAGGQPGGAAGVGAGGQPGGAAGVGGGTSIPYPKGGFGYAVGAVVEDLTFQGVWNPQAVGFMTAPNAVKISMHDFYNPKNDPAKPFDGSKPVALVVVIGALWAPGCGVVTQAVAGTPGQPGYSDYWKGKGALFMQSVYQKDSGDPAEFADLDSWTKKYDITFPSVLDPGAKLDAYFPTPGFPHALIFDLTTMKIAYAGTDGDFGPDNAILKQLTGN